MYSFFRAESCAQRLWCRKLWWKLQAPPPGGLIICGPTGSTRSGLATLLGQVLASHTDCRTHVVHVDCQSIEIDTLSSAKEQLQEQVGLFYPI